MPNNNYADISPGARPYITHLIHDEFPWKHPGERVDLAHAILSGDTETVNHILNDEEEHETLRTVLKKAENAADGVTDGSESPSTHPGWR